MKKTFRTILAGAVALLSVSCYDDLALREDIANLGDDLKGLEERITALENTLNAEVGGINDLASRLENVNTLLAGKADAADLNSIIARLDAIDGTDGLIKDFEAAIAELVTADATLDAKLVEAIAKICVVNVAEVDGKVELTLADGSKVALSKPLSNVENTGLVTIVEDEAGEKYWAVVLADGTVQNLDLKVGAAEAVDLEFRVAENNSLEYTLDGVDWVATGAYVADSEWSLLTDFYQGSEFDDYLWEEIVDDYYTLVFGGVEYQIPLYKVDNSVVTIKAGKTYFGYGESKSFDVALDGIASMYVMTKPDGWRAKLEGTVLTVVSPSEANIESELAEADGEVLLHCTTEEGKCKIARLGVSTLGGFSLTVTEDGKLTIVNPGVSTTTDFWGETNTDFTDAYVGLAPVAAFEADPVAYVAACPDNYDDFITMISGWKQNTMDYETGEYTIGGRYVPGEYEVDVIESTVNDLYKAVEYEDVPVGSRFVVWACPVDDRGMPRTDELVFGYFSSPVVATITAVDGGVSATDIEVSVNVAGADTYYVGVLPEEYMYGFPIDSYMQNQEGPFGYFQMAIQYGSEDYAFMYMGTQFGGESGLEMPATIKVSDLQGPLMPDQKIYMWVFPVVEGLALADYTYEENLKPYIYEFTTTKLQAGGSATVEFGVSTIDFTNMRVELEASDDVMMVYYKYYDPDQFNEIADVAADLIENGYAAADFPALAVNSNNVKPGSTFVLAAMAVDSEGKYGPVTNDTYETPTITFSETFKATIGEAQFETNGANWKVTMPVTVEGGEAAGYYYYWNATPRTEEQLKDLPLGNEGYYYYYYVQTIPALWFYSTTESYQFAVVVESTTGELSAPVFVTVDKPVVE